MASFSGTGYLNEVLSSGAEEAIYVTRKEASRTTVPNDITWTDDLRLYSPADPVLNQVISIGVQNFGVNGKIYYQDNSGFIYVGDPVDRTDGISFSYTIELGESGFSVSITLGSESFVRTAALNVGPGVGGQNYLSFGTVAFGDNYTWSYSTSVVITDPCTPPIDDNFDCKYADGWWISEDEVIADVGSGVYTVRKWGNRFLCSGGSFTPDPDPDPPCDNEDSKCVVLHARADGRKFLARCSDLAAEFPFRTANPKNWLQYNYVLPWINGCYPPPRKRKGLDVISIGKVKSSGISTVEVGTQAGIVIARNYQSIAYSAGDEVVVWAPAGANEIIVVFGKTS